MTDGYKPASDETGKRVGELKKHLNNFNNNTLVSGVTRPSKQVVKVK